MFRAIRFRLFLGLAALLAAALLFVFTQSEISASTVTVVLIFGVLAFFVVFFFARWLIEPLEHLTETARRIGAGDSSARARAVEPLEVNQLARAINQMAERSEETQQTLQSVIDRDQSVLTLMADGVILLDAQANVLQCNPAAETILAVRESDVIGRSFTLAARDHEMVECLREAQSKMQEATRVVEQVATRRFLRMVATPTKPSGAANFLIVLQDLTQIRRLETIRRDFIINVSHEFRTPLAGLQALVETLNGGALDDLPAARRFLALMEDETGRLNQIVNELLELAALESGRAPLVRACVDIASISQQAVERLRAQADRAGVRLEIAPVASVEVNADAARIEQVLLNLIHNAIKFTPAGGRVECRIDEEGANVTVSVRDTGSGIAEQDLPRIFERFYKADKGRAGRGTGLGLALAKHTVELHGGRIWAESVEGKGTTVSFTLPRG